MSEKREELVEITDGTDVQYRFEKDDAYWAVWDGQSRGLYRDNPNAEKLTFISMEFAQISLSPTGRRVWSAPRWYVEKLGLT